MDVPFELKQIADNIANLDSIALDSDNIECELSEINDSIQNLNDDLNERLDTLIEVIKNAK